MAVDGVGADADDPPWARRARFEELFTTESRAVLGYALRRVDVGEDAADVVAETFLVAWRRIDDVPAGQDARLWLYGVARRVLANHARGIRRRHRLAERLREELVTSFEPHRHGEPDAIGRVRDALGALDGADRELLQLTSWEGLTPTQLATVLGIPPATVRTRLFRARNRLKAELVKLGWDGERAGVVGHIEGDGHTSVRQKEDL